MSRNHWNVEVYAVPVDEVVGEVIDLQLVERAISLLTVRPVHVFSRNNIARGHILFAQANSLAVAVIDEELALTAKSYIKFIRQVKENEQVVEKAFVKGKNKRSEEHTYEI